VRIEEAHGTTEQGRERAGIAVGRAHDPQHLFRVVMGEIEGAVVAAAERAHRWRRHVRRARVRLAALHHGDCIEYAGKRRLGHFIAIEARLARLPHREFAPRPDRARIQFRDRFDQRHPPARRGLEDGPVEGRWTPVAARAGMHDQAAYAPPHLLRDRAFEEARDHEIGAKQLHRLAGDRIVDVELD